MSESPVIAGGLAILAAISGMLGVGVAFAAIPFLALFLPDLVNQVQPLSLLLDGVTALFAVLVFARSGCVDWRKTLPLSLVTNHLSSRKCDVFKLPSLYTMYHNITLYWARTSA